MVEDLVSKMYLSPQMASSIVSSKAVALLLFIHRLMFLTLFAFFLLDACFVLQ